MNILSSVARPVADVRQFLKDASSASSVKYVPQSGQKHHILVVPITQDVVDEATKTVVTKNVVSAIQCNVHEWKEADDKFRSTLCPGNNVAKDPVTGETILEGHCPICERLKDGWEIVNYRTEKEKAECGLTGTALEEHIKNARKNFLDQRKAKEPKPYLYLLIALFTTNDKGEPVLGDDKLPEYELKVMKLSDKRVDKFKEQVGNAGIEFAGAELILQYTTTDDRRLLVSQSTTTVVFPQAMFTNNPAYPGLKAKIDADVAKFEWDEIHKSFPELEGMPTAAAKAIMDTSFAEWDKYQIEAKTNPNAKYLEYVVDVPAMKPSIAGVGIAGAVGVMPNIPNVAMPNVPNVPPVAQPVVPQVAAPQVAAPEVPQVAAAPQVAAPEVAPVAPQMAPVPDANAVFNGATPIANGPTVAI